MERYVLMLIMASGPDVHDGERQAFGTFHNEAACWDFVKLLLKDGRYDWLGTCALESQYKMLYPDVPLRRISS